MQEKEIKISIKIRVISLFLCLLFFLSLFYFGLVYTLDHLTIDASKIILEYIRVLIWPAVIYLICFSFREEISLFIRRIVAGKFAGIEVDLTPTQSMMINETSLKTKLQGVSEENKDDIQAIIDEKERAIATTTEQANDLQKKLVEKEIELDFERIYNVIYRSQIDLLFGMSGSDHYGLNFIVNHFLRENNASQAFKDWTVFQYIAFLINNSLIEQRDTHTYAITIKGKAFLQYFRIMGYQKYGI